MRFCCMQRLLKFQKQKLFLYVLVILAGLGLTMGRLVYIMVFRSEYYEEKAQNLHEREREIKAARGKILDRNGVELAANQSVCTISVIHNQITDPEKVIEVLSDKLGMSEQEIRKRVEKVSSIERIRSNVSKEVGDAILEQGLDGVKVDADYKRYHPKGELASKVLGFTGSDNQGIIGLEVKYNEYLQGTNGKILTETDVRGVELDTGGERRTEPEAGNDLVISIDANIQAYCQQAAEKVMEEKQADAVSVILMKPDNGEIFAMVNVPEFDLNDPFTLQVNEMESLDQTAEVQQSEENNSVENRQDLLNQMWRNGSINDTYEPGSTFKIITTAAALEEAVVTPEDSFYCPGYKVVEDRRIRCHKTTGHGAETFTQGIMNSCNPVFIELGLRLGVERFYEYFQTFGLLDKTGVDLPGEAGTIMHDPKNMGQVELATVSFGQSFQITPLQLITTAASLINGGKRVTPHLALSVQDGSGNVLQEFSTEAGARIVSEGTSETLRGLLEKVVSEGTGKKAYIEGFSIGGKTATSQTLPRSEHRYISSFLGFAPAESPQVIGLVVIHDPKGIYYGGTIAAPVMKEIFENVLPYLGIEKKSVKNEDEAVAN